MKERFGFLKDKGFIVRYHNDGIGECLEFDIIDMHIDIYESIIVENGISMEVA